VTAQTLILLLISDALRGRKQLEQNKEQTDQRVSHNYNSFARSRHAIQRRQSMDSPKRKTPTNLLRNATNSHRARAQPHLSTMGHGNQRRNETNHQRQNTNHQKRRRIPHPHTSQTQSNVHDQNKSNGPLLRKNQIQNQNHQTTTSTIKH